MRALRWRGTARPNTPWSLPHERTGFFSARTQSATAAAGRRSLIVADSRMVPARRFDYREWVPAFRSVENQRLGDAGARRGIEPVLEVEFQRLITSSRTVEKPDWQVGRRKLCPRLCPNGCLPSTNTVTYGETPRETSPGGQVVETTAENVIRYVSTLLQRSAFQACSIDHSDISPFRINDLRAV